MPNQVFIATSLDGFIAREDGSLDWLPVPEPGGEDYGYKAFMDGIDAIVMGRGTFDVVNAMGGDWQYGKPIVLLTTRPLPDAVSLKDELIPMRGTPAEVTAQCAARGLTSLYIDGGKTIQQFLAAGLIERLIVTRVPVLLGEGLPLFGSVPQDIQLEHLQTQAYATGLVQSEYRVRTT